MTDPVDHTIYIRKRPSTPEEDEWAMPILRLWAGGGIRRLGCAVLLFGSVAAVVCAPFSWQLTLVIGPSAAVLAITLVAMKNFRTDQMLGACSRPLAEVLTVSLPVLDWYRIRASRYDPASWLARYGDNLFLYQVVGDAGRGIPSPILLDEDLGCRVELEYYLASPIPGKQGDVRWLLRAVRSLGEATPCAKEMQLEDVPRSAHHTDGWARDDVGEIGGFPGVPAIVADLRSSTRKLPGSLVDESR